VSNNHLMQLFELSKIIRIRILEICHLSNSPHLGSSLSIVELITALMFNLMKNFTVEEYSDRSDQFILSKGHASLALYATLEIKGFLKSGDFEKYAKSGSILEEHPNFKIPTVLTSTGSLGHGLAFANGLALANNLKGLNSRIFVLLSDGECNEGTVWESALLASTKNLHRVVAIIDHNKLQATGPINETFGTLKISSMFRAFGWEVFEIDGHNFNEILTTLTNENSLKPTALICHTIKGKGVSFMEGDNNWHYRAPNIDELNEAIAEVKKDIFQL
jgi:transketolase